MSVLPTEVTEMLRLLKRTVVALESIALALGSPVPEAAAPVVVPNSGRTHGFTQPSRNLPNS